MGSPCAVSKIALLLFVVFSLEFTRADAQKPQTHVSAPPRLTTDLDVQVTFPRCGASVRFSGKPRVFSKAELDMMAARPEFGPSFRWEMDVLIYVVGKINEVAVCGCRNSFFTDSEVAKSDVDAKALPGAQFIRSITSENLRSASEWDASIGAGIFTRSRSITAYPKVDKHCFMHMQVSYAEALAPEAEAFLRTFEVVPLTSGVNPEGRRPAASKPSVSARLTELKELLDRGLITKEEFERKRQSILDEL